MCWIILPNPSRQSQVVHRHRAAEALKRDCAEGLEGVVGAPAETGDFRDITLEKRGLESLGNPGKKTLLD